MEYDLDLRNHLRDLYAANVQIANLILTVVGSNICEDEVQKVVFEANDIVRKSYLGDDESHDPIGMMN